MRQIRVGMLWSVWVASRANAVEMFSNEAELKQVIMQAIVTQVFGTSKGTVNFPNATSHTGVATATGKPSQCWTKFVYHADGSKTPKVVCH